MTSRVVMNTVSSPAPLLNSLVNRVNTGFNNAVNRVNASVAAPTTGRSWWFYIVVLFVVAIVVTASTLI